MMGSSAVDSRVNTTHGFSLAHQPSSPSSTYAQMITNRTGLDMSMTPLGDTHTERDPI